MKPGIPIAHTFAAATLILFASLNAQAQSGPPGMPPPGPHEACRQPMHFSHLPIGPGAPVPPFLHGLNLDEAQQDKMFQVMHAIAPQLREQEKARFKAQRELMELSMSGKYSESKAKALAEQLARATAEIAVLRARSESQIYAVLTPEQRTQLEKFSRNPAPHWGQGGAPMPR